MKTKTQREDARRLVQAVELLPPDKREFILGYSKGVIDARKPDGAAETQDKP